ncbi:hypothetical protein Tco_0785106 [Tanacetum coccineum]
MGTRYCSCNMLVVLRYQAKLTVRNISLRLNGSFGTLKTPLTWGSGGDKLVSRSSKKQDCTSMSTAESVHSHLVQSSPAFTYPSTSMLSDLFNKALSEDRFKYLYRPDRMRCLTPDELEVLAIESA